MSLYYYHWAITNAFLKTNNIHNLWVDIFICQGHTNQLSKAAGQAVIELESDDRPSLTTLTFDCCRDFESSENTVVTNVQPALLKTSLKGETHPGQYLPFILNRWSLWVTIFWHVSFWCPCAEDNIRLCMRLFVFLCMHSAECTWRLCIPSLHWGQYFVFLFSPVLCVYFCLIAIESSELKTVCPDQIYCKWGRAPPRAPGILSPLPLILYFIKCVFCSGSGGEGDGLCNVAPSAYYHGHRAATAWTLIAL